MTTLVDLYRRAIVPATLALAVLSLGSAAIVLTGPLPQVQRVAPEAVRAGLVTGLVVLGAVLPLGCLLARRVRTRGHPLMTAVFFGATTAHAASLSELVRTPVQTIFAVLAVVLSLLLVLATLAVVADVREARPVPSRLKG